MTRRAFRSRVIRSTGQFGRRLAPTLGRIRAFGNALLRICEFVCLLRIWVVQTYKEYFIEQAQGKSWREWLALFPKIFSQKFKYLAILSTDFGEKLSDSS